MHSNAYLAANHWSLSIGQTIGTEGHHLQDDQAVVVVVDPVDFLLVCKQIVYRNSDD